jgi:hypothetical protein
LTGATFVLAALLALSQDKPSDPPPLTQEQRTRLTRLAHDTQRESARLKALLEERQQELSRVYAAYDLDLPRATQLEAEILDLQRQMLDTYRKMQVELRAVVSKERFMTLKKRIDNFLQSPAEKTPAKDQRPPPRP